MLVYTIWDLIGIVCLMILAAVLVFGFLVYRLTFIFENHHKNDGKDEEEEE